MKKNLLLTMTVLVTISILLLCCMPVLAKEENSDLEEKISELEERVSRLETYLFGSDSYEFENSEQNIIDIRGTYWEREGVNGYDPDKLEFFEDGSIHWSAGGDDISGLYEVISDDELLLRKEILGGYHDFYFGYEFDEDGWLNIWYLGDYNDNDWKIAARWTSGEYGWDTIVIDGLYWPRE